jgi:hypothetical protein
VAIPVITDHFQVQWAWIGPSLLPTDQFVTTWYFRNDFGGTPEAAGVRMVDKVRAWWMDTPTGQSGHVAEFLPSVITSAVAKVYDLGEPTPRYPVHTETPAGAAGGSTLAPLPREVALVNSYYGGPGPRARGRQYIGPLTIESMTTLTGGVPAPIGTLRERMVAASTDMATSGTGDTWVQCSTTYGTTLEVIGGWVDNAYDTQRRRGKAPSSRDTWGAPAT